MRMSVRMRVSMTRSPKHEEINDVPNERQHGHEYDDWGHEKCLGLEQTPD